MQYSTIFAFNILYFVIETFRLQPNLLHLQRNGALNSIITNAFCYLNILNGANRTNSTEDFIPKSMVESKQHF